ncbi:exodeoxyribonuclease VII large subunit [Pseudoflavonifractor phocaeensis]|uniref:exodeoxyribonuclease VII large subunit n=1 Tax=Pseudoflavonifractor phocaeensis TaxID=1870988 RepID=UPI001F17DDC9|nr:exodeoxyribonuclease VII large subunit [Pseudoflavonifractor phocaeensis]MCF2596498.1 exodeoxyribonuclease VII large subunit [Pseudoflavonifractor phocaeensis]
MRTETTILTPTQVGQYIKGFMDRDRVLSGLLVRGEISNYKMYPSGHHYFTLKDGEGALRCVMFRGDAASLRFRPQNGMQVIAAGRVTVFPRDGQYQLYCVRLTPEGAGDLHVAFEQLKAKLAREGLFDREHKKPVPRFPKTIALVTSPVGAAVRDMLRILGARWPMAQIKVLPVRVQGEGAAEEIAAAIRWANWQQAADLIITGRGGGSMEDLWAFNEEAVARAIYDSEIPVISAVGHEPDVTIADFVADLRAATPSNAAELAVPDQNEVYGALLHHRERLRGGMAYRLAQYRQRLDRAAGSRAMTEPASYFQNKRLLLDYQSRRLVHGLDRSVSAQKERLARLAASLDALSPLKVLGRGYAIAQKGDGTVLSSVKDAAPGDRFTLRLSDGTLDCRAEEVRN